MDIELMKKEFNEWANSEKGQEFFKGEAEKREITKGRYQRFEKWLEDNDIDKLMYRLILEHGDDYIDNCYHNGCMPFPNRKLNFVIGYIIDNHESIKVSELDSDFPNDIWQFKGYYIQHIYGQGTIFRLYNKDDNKLLLQL